MSLKGSEEFARRLKEQQLEREIIRTQSANTHKEQNNVQVKRDSIIFLAIIVIIAITIGISVHKNNDRLYEEYYEAYYYTQVESFINSRFRVGLLTLKIDIDAEQTAYNHLGDDISIEHFCNGTSISNRDTIKAQSELSFTTVITENDSTDDVGKKTITIDLPPFTQSKKISIKVVEKGGTKYKNASATWDITYTITPVLDGMAEIERRDVIEWAKSLQD